MKAYSEDLRRKVVEAVSRGMGMSEARTFGVSLSSVRRYISMVRQGRSLFPRCLMSLVRQIAAQLSTSEHTAATHVAKILRKLQLSSRAQITARAWAIIGTREDGTGWGQP